MAPTILTTIPIIQPVLHSPEFLLPLSLPPLTTTATAVEDFRVGIDVNDEVGEEVMGKEMGLGTEEGASTSELYRDFISESLRDCEKMATRSIVPLK
jgi:hypothetical protein